MDRVWVQSYKALALPIGFLPLNPSETLFSFLITGNKPTYLIG